LHGVSKDWNIHQHLPEILQSHIKPVLMTATLHYVREAINIAAEYLFIVVLKLDTVEMTASTVIKLLAPELFS